MAHTGFGPFLAAHLAVVEPLSRRTHVAYWDATISGTEEDTRRYAELELELQRVYSDSDSFHRLRSWHENGKTDDPLARRQVDILYNAFLRNQIAPEMIESITRLSTSIANRFNIFRASVAGKTLTSNEVKNILRTSTDSQERRLAWEAEKSVAAVVEDDLLQLVKLRNEAARSVGFENYYDMSLTLNEQNGEEVIALFDRLDELTRAPFAAIKDEIDTVMARRCSIATSELRPWHYEDPFFQEGPRVDHVDLDDYYRGRDVVAIVKEFFAGIGLDVAPILERSDLYEKTGKDQHAYCIDIDRRGDIRVLANVRDDENWAGTILHELGHAVYDRHLDAELPWLLREHAHLLVTEAVAMFFGRLSKNAHWIQQVFGISDEERLRVENSLAGQQRIAQLVFARWCQVMVRFERTLYTNPDSDLNAAWWDLVERYQMVTPPEDRDRPHWASKIHIVSAPVYYHNYMMGELLASQFDDTIRKRFLQGDERRSACVRETVVGDFFVENVFKRGKRDHWKNLVREATGEALNPRYFVEQFVGETR